MSMFLLALEWGTDSVLALVVALVALGAGGLALRRTHRGVRPFRRFRLVNKSKKINPNHARTITSATVVASGDTFVLTSNGPISFAPEGARGMARPALTTTSIELTLKAQGSTGSNGGMKSVTIPGSLALGWPADAELEAVDVAVADIDMSMSNFGYTLEITVARHLACTVADDCDVDVVTMTHTVAPSA